MRFQIDEGFGMSLVWRVAGGFANRVTRVTTAERVVEQTIGDIEQFDILLLRDPTHFVNYWSTSFLLVEECGP